MRSSLRTRRQVTITMLLRCVTGFKLASTPIMDALSLIEYQSTAVRVAPMSVVIRIHCPPIKRSMLHRFGEGYTKTHDTIPDPPP